MIRCLFTSLLLTISLSVTAAPNPPPTPQECQRILQTADKAAIERSGCCSAHDGVCGCASNGKLKCCDGATSPTCACNGPDREDSR